MKLLSMINFALQAANANNKEFWFASLNIAKTFDLASIPAIKKLLERINCPSATINLFINLLSNRKVSINTSFGATNFFTVNNGVKQGETISPILWIIFYDSLITQLSKQQPIQNYIAPNALTYMDDFVLIADSKSRMKNLLNIANQFFSINNIICNKNKTQIISNIKIKQGIFNTIKFSNYQIQILKPYQSVKYLGMLISLRNFLKTNRKVFNQSVNTIL